jgi:hypothetical protein
VDAEDESASRGIEIGPVRRSDYVARRHAGDRYAFQSNANGPTLCPLFPAHFFSAEMNRQTWSPRPSKSANKLLHKRQPELANEPRRTFELALVVEQCERSGLPASGASLNRR